jgi:hypothetical protein
MPKPKQKPKKVSQADQSKAFKEKAREIGCAEHPAAEDAIIRRLAQQPQRPRKGKG